MGDPVYLSIRERIMVRLLAILDAVTEVGSTARRFDVRESRVGYKDGDIIISVLDEPSRQEDFQLTYKSMRVACSSVIVHNHANNEASETTVNRRLQVIEKTVIENHTITELGGTRLAIKTETASVTGVSQNNEGYGEASVLFDIDYQHNRGQPWIGPGITAVEE